jgi:hypothetical protein
MSRGVEQAVIAAGKTPGKDVNIFSGGATKVGVDKVKSGKWASTMAYLPYQEACEEASIIMVHHFLDGTDITPQGADKEIQDIVAWENTTFHSRADVTAEELQRIAEDYYQYTGQLFYDFSIDDMKRLLAHGYPIIVPLAGRDLGNPYYSGQGPWYHMLVITGYDGNDFITNDVGTKRGKDYRYPTQVVYNAIHDWNQQEEDIHGGRKVILVLER